MRYFIVDDDRATRKMLQHIIEHTNLGTVIGEADNGQDAIGQIALVQPDIVLIDLLMPQLDGISTVEQLKKTHYEGQFVMISQVVNKQMVGEAYEQGIDFFIHKPINKVEVEAVLRRMNEQFYLKTSLRVIRQSLTSIDEQHHKPTPRITLKDQVQSILNDLSIIGEVGSKDILNIIDVLEATHDKMSPLPPLRDLYEKVALRRKEGNPSQSDISKECKAIEQRIRRTILAAMVSLANLGLVDYTSTEFEYYAPRYFDFSEIRLLMAQIKENKEQKVKVNTKKFIQVLFVDAHSKIN